MNIETPNRVKSNIIITGVSSGIGQEILNNLKLDDSIGSVFAITSQPTDAKLAVDGKIRFIPIDYSNAESIDKLSSIIGDIPIHGVILNAGLLDKVKQGTIDHKQLLGTFNVNTFYPILILQAINNNIISGKAHVIGIGSMGGFQGASKFPGLSIYSASKSALSTFIECYAQEMFNNGVRANTLALGAVNTKMLNKAFPGYEAPVNAKDISKYILDFLFHGGDFITGKVIPVSLVNPS
jgi:short-subunit dehydrogenase